MVWARRILAIIGIAGAFGVIRILRIAGLGLLHPDGWATLLISGFIINWAALVVGFGALFFWRQEEDVLLRASAVSAFVGIGGMILTFLSEDRAIVVGMP